MPLRTLFLAIACLLLAACVSVPERKTGASAAKRSGARKATSHTP